MELFLYWLLRASVLMVLFYGLYAFFFAKNTFHQVNRFLLIAMLGVISILPLFRFNLIPEKKVEMPIETLMMDLSAFPITEITEMQVPVEIPWVPILMILFGVGFLVTFGRYLIGLSQIIGVIRKSEKEMLADGSVLCITDRFISPFSWMKYIVLSRKDLSSDHQMVIRHERAHIHLRHSFDMILFDLFTALFWFNPFSWLLRREIQSVHEYQADEQVLNYGINSTQYQLLLIRKSVGEYKFALANNFRQRDLRKRIMMMKKRKTNKKVKWSYAIALPVLFLAMMGLSLPKLNATLSVPMEIDEVIQDQSGIVVAGMVKDAKEPITGVFVSIKGAKKGTVTDVNGNFSIKADEGDILQFTMAGCQVKEYVVEKEIDNLVVHLVPEDAKEANASKETRLEIKAVGAGKVYSAQDVKGKMNLLTSDGKEPLYIVDREIVSSEKFQKISPDIIKSVTVLKDKSATETYGEIGKDGVVLIETKTKDEPNVEIKVIGNGKKYSSEGIKGKVNLITTTAKISSGDNLPLIIIDGEKMSKDFKLNAVTPDDIESVSVLKGQSAVDLYSDEGKDGVILVKTKKTTKGKQPISYTTDTLVISSSTNDHHNSNLHEFASDRLVLKAGNLDSTIPLIIVDGEKMPKDFKLSTIDPDNIKSVSILKDEKATSVYGEEAKDGVIIITKKSL